MSPNTTITEMAFQQHKKEQKEVTLTELRVSTTWPKIEKNILSPEGLVISFTLGALLMLVDVVFSF